VMVYTNITDVVRRNEELEILRSALNQIDHGVLLLNRNLQIVFMNRAVREMGHLRPLVPGERPFFSDLLRQMAVSGVYASAPDNTETYVASHLAWVQEDNPAPVHVRMTDGKTLCVRCVVLRNGTRVILYTDETETMQQVDKLEELASQDSMTGLHNRRRFLELAESEWSRHRRHQRPLSLLMLDIDHFKLVNDNFGHDVGDRLISQLGAICSGQKRQSDIAARFGGEEFVLLLPETSLSDAAIFADRLRTAIANQPLAIGECYLDMTVSIGVAEATPEMADLSVLIKRADTALYAAKRGGRNRVCTIAEVESAAVVPASAA
ncbi:MAG: diguanylate cyclase, partial [Pseudorhodoplanes sp.]|nr:diguanylate cyclase [Pseudorhodoplanes sp.]